MNTSRSLIARLAGRARLAICAGLLLALAVALPAFGAFTIGANGPGNGPNAGALTLTLDKPTPLAAGDFMLATVAFRGASTVVVSPPSGWQLVAAPTEAKRTNTTLAPNTTQVSYYKVADATDVDPLTTSYQWDFDSAVPALGGIVTYTDIATSNPIDKVATNPATDSALAASTSLTAPTVSTDTAFERVVALYALDTNATVAHTAPAGLTSVYTAQRTSSNAAGNRARVAAADMIQPAAGSTGSITATASASSDYVAHTITLRRRATRLAYTTPVRSGLKNTCFSEMTVQTQGGTNPVNVTADTVVDLTTDGTGSFFSDSGCTTPLTEADRTLNAGENSFSFYYMPTVTGDGTHQITASATGLTSANQTENVTKLDQLITFTQPPQPQTFGDTFNVDPTSDSLLPVTVVGSGGCTAVQGTTGWDVTMTSGTTACHLVASQPGDDDYNAAPDVSKDVTAAKKAQTITFDDAPTTPQTFGTTFHVDPASDSGLPVALADGGNSEGCDAQPALGGGFDVTITRGNVDCNLTASQAGDNDYAAATPVPQTVETQKADQTITFTQPASPQTYGDTFNVEPSSDSGLTVSLGAVDGCSAAADATPPGFDVTMTDGTTACVLTASQAGNGNFNAATDVVRNVQANKRQLTVSGAVAQGKTYNGNDNATVDFTAATLDGEAFSDVVEEDSSGYSANFNDKNVGTGKPVTVTGVVPETLTGNYTVVQPTGLTADVTVLDTAASFTAADKFYDGTRAAATPSRTVANAVSGDAVALGGAATFANELVGNNKVVTIATPTLTGADAGNYNLTPVGTDTANIVKRPVVGSFTAANKDYDGTTAATITGRSLINKVTGDAVSLTGGTATFDNANPGNDKTVTGTGFALGGGDAANYNLVSINDTTADIQRDAGGSTPPPKDVKKDAENALGGEVTELPFDLNNLGYAFAPADQTNTLKVGKKAIKLFAIGGCDAPCTVKAKKTLILIGTADGASAAATKRKMKLKTQNLSLAAGEFGVIKLKKLTRKQRKAIKKAQKSKLVVKTTLTSGGESASFKKKYKLKLKK